MLSREIIDHSDPSTSVVYLELPPAKVVVFQAAIEICEGLGTIRTIDSQRGIISIYCTPSSLSDLEMVLDGLSPIIPWTQVEPLISANEIFNDKGDKSFAH